ncbi:MAG: YgjV family protein [Gemmatimonadota bacterium]
MIDLIGYLATAFFVASYLSKRAATLRRIQSVAALLWLTYGVLIHAMPVIVANAIVAGVALWSSFGIGKKPGQPASP